MANLLSSLVSQASSGSIPIPPDALRTYLRSQPAYNDNRERAAVVLDQGFRAYDAYVKAKPYLFVGSLISGAFSGYALYKRRKKGTEAVVLHSANLVISMAVAFITRPGTTPTPPPGTSAQDAAGFNVVATLDAKRKELKKTNPLFADQVFNRLAQMPGIREQLANAPLVRAAVV